MHYQCPPNAELALVLADGAVFTIATHAAAGGAAAGVRQLPLRPVLQPCPPDDPATRQGWGAAPPPLPTNPQRLALGPLGGRLCVAYGAFGSRSSGVPFQCQFQCKHQWRRRVSLNCAVFLARSRGPTAYVLGLGFY